MRREWCAREVRALLVAGLGLAVACARTEERAADYQAIGASSAELAVLTGHAPSDVVWTMGEDRRLALFQHPPSRLAVRLRHAPAGCELRFALGLKEEAWERSDGATFRVALRRGDDERTVFEEDLAPAALGAPAWLDRVVALPDDARFAGGDGVELVLETTTGRNGSADSDWVAWAAPHVVCSTPAARPRRDGPPDVVLVSLDTLRADRLGVYGADPSPSPTLDTLARESLVFDEAFAVAPYTLATHASMFTGLYPSEHRAGHDAPLFPMSDAPPTLASRLRDAGYRTLAFTAGGIVHRGHGIARGFETWVEHTRVGLPSMLPTIFDALGAAPRRPTFLFVHTYDIHGPYPGVRRADAGDDAAGSGGAWRALRAIPALRYLALDRYPSREAMVRGYDEGVRSTDRTLGALFDRLREIGVWDGALVVVTSDHGETLFERGDFVGHTFSLHDEVIRVPLVVKLPHAVATGRSDELVEQVDLLPTVLAAVGLPAEPGVSGSDVLARVRGEQPAKERVRGEAVHTGARYVRDRRWKVIAAGYPAGDARSRVPAELRDRVSTAPQAYDLRADAGELHDLATGDPLRARPSAAWSAPLSRAESLPLPGTLPGEYGRAEAEPPSGGVPIEQLRALGYGE